MKCVDLFSGCGGLSLGFQNADIKILAALDHWNKAVDVYRDNFSHPCYLHDISDKKSTLALIKPYMPDMLIGGPPCQDFSSAGKRDETLGRADLTYDFANIVCEYRPQWFVMENVERIKSSAVLANVVKQFINTGYGLTAVILNSAFCHTPQSRNRFFLIGGLGIKNNALTPIFQKLLTDTAMTIRDYLGDSLGLDYYYRHPRNYNRRGVFSIDEPSPTVRGVNRPVPPGYKKHRGDPQHINLSEIRPLTTIERSYLQTFPKDFKFQGAKTNLEQMIGNAVPVNMANLVAKGILEYISDNKDCQFGQIDMFETRETFVIPKRKLVNFNLKNKGRVSV